MKTLDSSGISFKWEGSGMWIRIFKNSLIVSKEKEKEKNLLNLFLSSDTLNLLDVKIIWSQPVKREI